MWELLVFVLGLLHPPMRTFLRPKGVYVTYTENPGELRVSWLTYLEQWRPQISYRLDYCTFHTNSTDWLAVPATRFVTTTGTRTYDRHIVNSALVQNLLPLCVYEYEVGWGMLHTQRWRVTGRTGYHPDRADEIDLDLQASFIVFGDMGSAGDSAVVRRHINDFLLNTEVHAILHSGDVMYDLKYSNPSFIRRYFTEIESFAAHVPYLVVPGNHEKEENFTKYEQMFLMQKNNAVNSSLYYSFNLGRAHIIMYCAEFLFLDLQESEETHRNWLVADLAEANRHRDSTPWIIAVGHRPLYCGVDWRRSLLERYGFQSNLDCYFRASVVRSYLEDIFYQAGVDLVITSHVHNYERFGAIYQNKSEPLSNPHWVSDPHAPVYLVSGTAGNREGNDAVTPTPDPWQQHASSNLGFGRLLVANTTHLYWEQWNSETQLIEDYFWIHKTTSRYSPMN